MKLMFRHASGDARHRGDSRYLGISYQKEPSFIPSRIGNISDSYISERVNKYLSDKKNTKK